MDASYFGNQEAHTEVQWAVRWPEHQWNGETIPEHVSTQFLSREAAEQIARTGFNRTFDEVPGKGVVVSRTYQVSAWIEVQP